MAQDAVFSIILILTVAGAAVDVFIGRSLSWRRPLQIAVVIGFCLTLLTIPSCRHGDGAERPDPEIPYRF